jgi:hypothetical protein
MVLLSSVNLHQEIRNTVLIAEKDSVGVLSLSIRVHSRCIELIAGVFVAV